MAISHIGSGVSGSFGFTANAGDLIILEQIYVTAATVPDAAAGYTTLQSGTQGTSGHRFSYKIAVGTETAPYSSTPANQSAVVWSVFRSSAVGLQVGANDLAKGTGTTATIPALTLNVTDGSSWVYVGVLSRTSTQAQMAGAITGTTLRVNNIRVAAHSTSAGVSSWSALNKSGMASEAWAAASVEIVEITVVYGSGAGSSAGAGSASATGSAVRPAAGSSAGTGTVAGVGFASSPGQGSGVSAGVATVSGVGRSTRAGVGSSAGVATVAGSAFSPVTISGVGSASGVATVAAYPLPLPAACRILIGHIPGASYGVRISESGYNAAANPVDNERLLFSSDWPEVMPIHQVGSFVHRLTSDQGNDVVQTVSYSGLGYIPFVDFMVKGNGDALPVGTDAYPSSEYFDRKTMIGAGEFYYWRPLVSGDSIAYLRLNVSSTQIRAQSFVRNLSGNNSQGAPRTWTIYYVIYRRQAVI